MSNDIGLMVGPSIPGLVTDIQVNVFIGKYVVVAELSKLTYVDD